MTLQFANDFMLITNEIYLNGLKGPEEAQYLGSQRAPKWQWNRLQRTPLGPRDMQWLDHLKYLTIFN